MRPRIPLAYAGLLIVAFVAVIGFAAFSPSADSTQAATADDPVATPAVTPASARVASAVLALRVSDAESRTATTESPSTTTTTTTPIAEVEAALPADGATDTDESTTSTEATTTTEAETTTTSARDTTPPSLKVTSPADGSTVTENLVTFVGEAEPGAHVASGPYAATIDEDGNWSLILVLTEGPNGAVFTATDHAGNSSTERVVVHYEPPQASTTTTTTSPGATTTTTAGTTWSPLWPADAGGQRDVEYWRDLVAQYWPAERVDCALGLIYRESRGDPRAYNSYSWAEGLFQHLRKYWYGRAKAAGFIDGDGLVATPYNGEANIAAAAYIAGRADPWYRPWGSSFPESAKYGSCQSDDPA